MISTPNDLLDAIGYNFEPNLVGLYMHGDRLCVVFAGVDDETFNAAPFRAVLDALPAPPDGVTLGGLHCEATHWMVIDRAANTWSVVPAEMAFHMVTGTPMKAEPVEE